MRSSREGPCQQQRCSPPASGIVSGLQPPCNLLCHETGIRQEGDISERYRLLYHGRGHGNSRHLPVHGGEHQHCQRHKIRRGGEGICASLGDSTFLHSGMTGLLNAAYNQARITVTILDNSTTAMTGHQPHPGTGVTATGQTTVQISLEALARALGAGLVESVDPNDLEGTMEGFQRARDYPGLSVVIARQPCVIKARRGERGPEPSR